MQTEMLKPLKTLISRKDKATPAAPAANPPAPDNGGGVPAVQHVWSDRPDALKFQVGCNLLPIGQQRHFSTLAEATESPLAARLLEQPGVESVTLESIYITVVMAGDADWDALMQTLPERIAEFFRTGENPIQDTTLETKTKNFSFGFKQVESRPREEQMQLVQELFEKEVNPAIASHGGYFNLLDIQDNKVYVELGGGCQGCSMANVTLRQGVEVRLKEVLPEMVALIDQTDHAAGTNPYYQQSKK